MILSFAFFCFIRSPLIHDIQHGTLCVCHALRAQTADDVELGILQLILKWCDHEVFSTQTGVAGESVDPRSVCTTRK